jgi:hypothetical protein
MTLTAYPSPTEALGAALIAAGFPQASFTPPQLEHRHVVDLGGCTAGWLIAPVALPGEWVRCFYRPEGNLDPTMRADVQRAQLRAYADKLPAGWEAMLDRRAGVPSLLARKVDQP